MLFLLLFLFSCRCRDADDYVSLELKFGGEKTTTSHLLTTTLTIGKPERRYEMLLDFTSNEIAMKYCMHSRSYTFDIGDNKTSDIVLFSDDTLLDPVKRGIYRFPITERCSSSDPFPSTECLSSDSCGGVLGLGPKSPVWVKWSAATITKTALHLGMNNPRRLTEKEEKVACEDESKLCSFNAIFVGRPVVVDFHSHDSYIYVPNDIYQRYTEERNLYGFTNAQKRTALHLQEARQAARVYGSKIDVEENASEPNSQSRILFAERLENERQLALQYSAYYRATHEITDRAAWPPIVLLPVQKQQQSSSTSNMIVLDFDLLVHSPLRSGSYGLSSSRLSSSVPFAEYSNALMTLMLRPHANESITDRVSLGNTFFRRYNVHRNYATNSIEIVEKFATENLANVEVLGGLYLYAFFIYSLCRMMSYSVTLSVSLNRRCSVCGEAMSPYAKHRLPPTLLSILAIFCDMLMLLIAGWLLQHVETFLSSSVLPGAAAFSVWSWLLFVPNALVVLVMAIASPGHNSPSDGTFCWRTFRLTVTYAACSEQVALLGLLWMTIILHTDTLGTTLSVFVAAAMFFSAVHHFSHVVLFEHDLATHLVAYFLRQQPSPAKRIFPSERANMTWFFFVLLVLFMLNIVLTLIVTLRYIVLPVLNSSTVAVVIYGLALLMALWLLETYERITISRTKFKNAMF